jgi:uncharacterized protein YdeI (YjbR/CyaY-like superfamily)
MHKEAAGRISAVDAYISKAADFAQPVLRHLREVLHEGAPGVVEEMKWSRPFFVYKGVILGNISAFKEHCSFGLWGPEVSSALRDEGAAKANGMGTFGKIASVDELPSRKKLVGYVKLGAKAIDVGERTKTWSRPKVAKGDVVVPEVLAAALKKNKAAEKKFETMTPGAKREYCDWISEAKREATREQRVETAVAWIGEGKSRNWKYERT